MQRDPGPVFSLGYGVNTRQHLNFDEGEKEGIDPESGIVAKAFRNHPVAKFFAVSAVTMVGMHVAGNLVRHGGMHLGYAVQEKPWMSNIIKDFSAIRGQLDEWQGINRVLYDDAPPGKLWMKGPNGKVRSTTEHAETLKGFFFTKGEQERARRLGIDKVPASWSWADEVQQRMISQGRRLPYELPAAYLAQRGLTDRLFGEDPHSKKVNWHNPVDVLTDFVTQSTRNVAFMIAPFEAGTASTTQTWRKLMTYGDDAVTLTPNQQSILTGTHALKTILGRLGADATDLLNKTVKFSSQSTGAFATGIREAQQNSMSFVQYYDKTRKGQQAWAESAAAKKMSKAGKTFHQATSLFFDHSSGTPLIDPWDQIPGPFRGMASGFRGAKRAYKEIGESYDAFEKMMQYGSTRFESLAKSSSPLVTEDEFHAVRRAYGTGQSSIEELGGRVEALGHGGPGTGRWRSGEFYRSQVQNEYQKVLKRQLMRNDISETAADRFVRMSRVLPGLGHMDERDISQRIFFGKGEMLAESTDDFWNEFQARLSMFDPQERQNIAGKLKPAMDRADTIFENKLFKEQLNRKIENQWNFFESRVLPRYGGEILKNIKEPYQRFDGNLTPSEYSYLRRKSASIAGIPLIDSRNARYSDDVISAQLARRGLDPNNQEQLRAYLTHHNAIAKPWHKEGRNLFGLKPLTVSEGLSRGYFRSGTHTEEQIAALTNRMAYNDPVSGSIGMFRMSGVYQTAGGRVLDFSSLKRKGTRFVDRLAADVQVPLIHLKPLDIWGYRAVQDLRQRSILQYVPSMTEQSFLPGRSETDDFYMWMRSGGRGSKGRIHAFRQAANQTFIAEQMPGEYRPFATGGGGLASKHLRFAVGQTGKMPYSDAPTPKRWRQLFSVNPDQPDSLINAGRRFFNRADDISNPMVLARKVGAGESISYEAKTAKAFNNLIRFARRQGISGRTARSFRGTELEDLFSFNVGADEAVTLRPGKNNLTDLETPAQILEAANILGRQNTNISSLSPDKAASLRRAQGNLIWRHLNEAAGPSYWDAPATNALKSSTVHTRIDELKADLFRYLPVRSGIVENADFNDVMPGLITKLSELRASGAISHAEMTEARTAVLSMQINYETFANFDRTASQFTNKMNVFNSIVGGGADTRETLNIIGRGEVGAPASLLGSRFTPFFRRHFGMAAHDFEGVEYNPFGNTGTVFVPTAKTAFERDARGTASSILGGNTWSNPETFSAASIPMSHLVERMNRYFGTVGLGIDQTAFKGPLDFYARGMIGKRVLPAVGAATIGLTIDRTIGGYSNPKDQYGDRVYSPYFLGAAASGVVEAQSALAGIIPGGEGYSDKREELLHGEVPVRAGRYWPLGNTPFKGGRVQYFRPSWYQRLESGYSYTDQTSGSPLEKLAYGYDFSPLRPFDPYRFERQHYNDRPYPVTGDYFTGPWGPLTPALNMTVGRILKPRLHMHREELEYGLGQYMPVGEGGAYLPTSGLAAPGGVDSSALMGGSVGGTLSDLSMQASISSGGGGGVTGYGAQAGVNAGYARAANSPIGASRYIAKGSIAGINATLANAAYDPMGVYGIPPGGGIPPRTIAGTPPLSPGNLSYQAGDLGYRAQELSGIYGFMLGSARESLGFGSNDFSSRTPILASSSMAYGSTRSFWDLNLGGLGDAPLPLEGNFANLEFSEIMRRFIPKERSANEVINPIPNDMGKMYPWLPGPEYFTNFRQGDPFTSIDEGEMRLPGQGYERLHRLHSDRMGKYGLVDQYKILADVAPWSPQYKALNSQLNGSNIPESWREEIETTREQVAMRNQKYNFSPYKYKYSNAEDLGLNPIDFQFRKAFEQIGHNNTYINTKFLPYRTATEDWERENVYGSTFPQWQHPIKDFLKPMVYNASQRNPIAGAFFLGTAGRFFGVSPQAKNVASVIGGGIGLAAGGAETIHSFFTGERYMPATRRKELAVEEYTDILKYVQGMRNYGLAKEAGDPNAAAEYKSQAQQTMFGADIFNANLSQLSMAIPKRKREHFKELINAPVEERKQILSTAGRLERRIYEAAWGMPVEERPNLEDYFSEHELPNSAWEGWHPNTNLEQVKVKIGQNLGLDMSQMGYYPQQIREANLINPSYPDFRMHSNKANVHAQLRGLLQSSGIYGDVVPVITPYPGTRVQINAGVG